MEEIRFSLQGSTGLHTVIVRRDGGNLTLLCSCALGGQDNLCKHRIEILTGITSHIKSGNANKINTVNSWIEGTDVSKAMLAMREAHIHLSRAQEDYDMAKKVLIKAIND